LDRVITRPEPTETFRAYAGYAGWAPGQLEAEMATGAWATVMADSLTVFDKDPAQLWQDLLEQLLKPRVISSNPSSGPFLRSRTPNPPVDSPLHGA
jgi:putative transcriptional regulator